ncbi:cell wall-active antibiotics response protein LiaF [Geobacillus sp. TFV-3]|uniref:cell wall-active antibiotics response protein LiaF n=1 Tax=Geobacillus sp. TFV-3 TaxID=1897059 RepID=UPI00135C85EB|nr:cell wall-active antibiotics response protein LiaF [Geobacillus sp. TFV-3]KAF0993910.1 hypothetical protein BJQ97_00535 [Geobacillus sp. TFV-3]
MLDQRKKTDYVSWVALVTLLLFAIEISFFRPGVLFSLSISVGLIYVGRKKRHRRKGKWLFWLGCIMLAVHVLTMMAARFVMVALLGYALWQWFQSKRHPMVIRPPMTENLYGGEEIVRRQPLFQNVWVGRQATPEQSYEWNDVNIQTGIGDTVIDVSYTVLPKGEAVIIVRGLIGNIQILVPYEIETRLVHSAIFGVASLFGKEHEKMFNETLIYQTSSYDQAEQKLKIVTSMIIGNVEVKRV